jgi:hypothetical protein
MQIGKKENSFNRCQSEKRREIKQMPIGKTKTTLTDANRKKRKQL